MVLDCGAWKGHFTLLASRLIGKDGIVYSFEPQKEMCDKIKTRLLKHKINNVIQINFGLFSHTTTIHIDKNTHSGFSILNENYNGEVEIKLIDLDTFVNKTGVSRINFIKMDIEGAEIEALEGAKLTLKKFSPYVAIASYHKRDGIQTAQCVEKYLLDLGYKSWTDFPAHLTTYGIR